MTMQAALSCGAYQQETRGNSVDWISMNTALRDGTIIEIRNNYGVAPSYGIYRWTNETKCISNNGISKFKDDKFSWQNAQPDQSGSPFDETSLTWRPYNGTVEDYRDPTEGMQNDMAYWRGAVASKYGLPLNHFEELAKNNELKNKTSESSSLFERIISKFF